MYMESVCRWIESMFAGSTLDEWHGSHCKFKIPRLAMSLALIFATIEDNKHEQHIVEYGVSQSSLEQIFVSIAKHQHEETAEVDG